MLEYGEVVIFIRALEFLETQQELICLRGGYKLILERNPLSKLEDNNYLLIMNVWLLVEIGVNLDLLMMHCYLCINLIHGI